MTDRTIDRIRYHYEVEKELALRLMNASREERLSGLYTDVYDELFMRVPDHPQLTKKVSKDHRDAEVDRQVRRLKRWLSPTTSFLEIGAGDCALSFRVSGLVKKVYALDVSEVVTKTDSVPNNFQLIISDGVKVPVKNIDVAYSNQLMEHIHPDDAEEQLRNIYDALSPNGVYVCITPNRLDGPHDVSKFFDKVSTGFHLKEYTLRELNSLFGIFRKVKYMPVRMVELPIWVATIVESAMACLPYSLRKKVMSVRGMGSLIVIVGYK